MTLESWTGLIRASGASMNADRASGVLTVCFERLALHYGTVDPRRLDSIRQDGAYGRGVKDVLDFVNIFAATAQGGEKNVIGRFMAQAQKRFGRFA
jgi:hypothetical protein